MKTATDCKSGGERIILSQHIMKKIIFLSALIALVGCDDGREYKKEASGSPYEIVVVAADSVWKGAPGDTLCAILQEDVEMLNQPEPLFDIVHTTPKKFNNILTRHRNIIRMEVDPAVVKTTVDAAYDVDSKPQMILYMRSNNADSLAMYLSMHRTRIQELLNDTEIVRFAARARRFPEQFLADTVKSMFGIDMVIPRGYKLRKSLAPNFMWMSYETPLTSQGIVIYTYPVDTLRQLSVNEIVAQRNAFVAAIPGPSDGSYMTTSSYLPPYIRPIEVNGRTWAEVRGFWDVAGDFMGGPFVSYTTIDKENGRAIVIDEYVYSPKQSKGRRNFIRQMESIVRNVNF